MVGVARGVHVQSRFCCEAFVCLQAGSGAGLAQGMHVQAKDLLAVHRIYVRVCTLGGRLALYGWRCACTKWGLLCRVCIIGAGLALQRACTCKLETYWPCTVYFYSACEL